MFLDDFNILILKINFFNIFLNKNILKNNYYRIFHHLKSVFGSVIVVTFQIVFRAEIHVNDIFYILKIIFNISTSKQFKKYKSHLILTKFF
jgi:hypothetical protein